MLFMNPAGKIAAEPPTVSFLDHGFLFGDSIYEVTRSYNRKLFGWKEHLERFIRSAERTGIPIANQVTNIEGRMKRLFKELNEPNAAVRIVITRGIGKLNIDYRSCAEPQIFMAIWKLSDADLPASVKLMVPKIRRNSRDALDPAIKSGNYLNSVLALKEAVDAGFDDALLLNPQGEVTELTTSNIGWFRGDQIETPHVDVGILHGITRRFLCEKKSVKVAAFKESDLENVDELFVLSTIKEVLPVSEIRLSDGALKKFNDTSFKRTTALREEFRQLILKRLESEQEFY